MNLIYDPLKGIDFGQVKRYCEQNYLQYCTVTFPLHEGALFFVSKKAIEHLSYSDNQYFDRWENVDRYYEHVLLTRLTGNYSYHIWGVRHIIDLHSNWILLGVQADLSIPKVQGELEAAFIYSGIQSLVLA